MTVDSPCCNKFAVATQQVAAPQSILAAACEQSLGGQPGSGKIVVQLPVFTATHVREAFKSTIQDQFWNVLMGVLTF